MVTTKFGLRRQWADLQSGIRIKLTANHLT